ncbi:uncharacterized protein VTP21DRAFT_7364 [Calcarisporiella thermophila]|uniref:uncharacterized protein n=1 Tax=Calcarisporiella thermophila TaxID=911321 RepID=UPI0037437D38
MLKTHRLRRLLRSSLLYYTAIFLFLLLVAASDASTQASDDVICPESGGPCYPRIFKPEEDFKEVLEGQEIPAGLHVKLDFGTGKKYAKLDNEPFSEGTSSIVLVKPEENKDENSRPAILHKPSELDEIVKNDENPILSPALNPNKPNPHIPQSDREAFDQYIKTLRTLYTPTPASHDELIVALDGLEELSHELDFGVRLTEDSAMKVLMELLKSPKSELRSKAALVMGVACQNNPVAQQTALDLHLLHKLLDCLSKEEDEHVQRYLVYALSNLVRGNRKALDIFFHEQGMQRLAQVYSHAKSDELRAKCVVMVADVCNPDMVTQPPEKKNTTEGLIFQKADPWGEIVPGGEDEWPSEWCQKLEGTLFKAGGTDQGIGLDLREKVLRAYLSVRTKHPQQCSSGSDLKSWLQSELKSSARMEIEEYSQLVEKVFDKFGH